jgi:hypothetical protein
MFVVQRKTSGKQLLDDVDGMATVRLARMAPA